jgi:hypothetical protein
MKELIALIFGVLGLLILYITDWHIGLGVTLYMISNRLNPYKD